MKSMNLLLFLVFSAFSSVFCDVHVPKRPRREAERKVKFDFSQEKVMQASEWFNEAKSRFEEDTEESAIRFLDEGIAYMRHFDHYAQYIFNLAGNNAKYDAIDKLFELGFRMDVDTITLIFTGLMKDDSPRAFASLRTIHSYESCILFDMTETLRGFQIELALKSSDAEKCDFVMSINSPLEMSVYRAIATNFFIADDFEAIEKLLEKSNTSIRNSIVNHLYKEISDDSMIMARLDYLELFFKFGMTPYRVDVRHRENIIKAAECYGHHKIIRKLGITLKK